MLRTAACGRCRIAPRSRPRPSLRTPPGRPVPARVGARGPMEASTSTRTVAAPRPTPCRRRRPPRATSCTGGLGCSRRAARRSTACSAVLSYVAGSSPNNWYIEAGTAAPQAQSEGERRRQGPSAEHGSMVRSADGIFTITSTDGAGAPRSSATHQRRHHRQLDVGRYCFGDVRVADCAQYASSVVDFSSMSLTDVRARQSRRRGVGPVH